MRPTGQPRLSPALRGLLAALALLILGGVFAAYLAPHVVVDLANQLWACF